MIGTPEIEKRAERASASASVAVGGSVTGSAIMPDWDRLTRSTSPAWSATVRLRWTTPMPPSRASAIAIGASVTLSMAADTTGTCSRMPAAKQASVRTSSGSTSV